MDTDDASELSDRAVIHNHYTQSKGANGNGHNAARLNNILLGCLLAIVGFMGIQVWSMNDRLARVETSLTFIAAQQVSGQP